MMLSVTLLEKTYQNTPGKIGIYRSKEKTLDSRKWSKSSAQLPSTAKQASALEFHNLFIE